MPVSSKNFNTYSVDMIPGHKPGWHIVADTSSNDNDFHHVHQLPSPSSDILAVLSPPRTATSHSSFTVSTVSKVLSCKRRKYTPVKRIRIQSQSSTLPRWEVEACKRTDFRLAI